MNRRKRASPQPAGLATGLDQYEQRPQVNERFNVSCQRRPWFDIVADSGTPRSNPPHDDGLNGRAGRSPT